jgi:aminoglycoside 6'-N-acetyltransferase
VKTSAYRFRSMAEADLPLISRWRSTPHVIEWWGAPSVEDAGEKRTDPRIAMWIVELEGRSFAFAQDYNVHGWSPHP